MRPQEGYQEKVLSSEADIVIGGGGAGAGKTFSLLLDPIRGFGVKGFRGVIFRRTSPQIKGGGGLWDESENLYMGIPGARGSPSSNIWRFESGAELQFSHLEYEKDIFSHQGLQYAFIGFDELTHFTKKQFFYLLSRNRSTCGVKPYIRCTCNPDPESWVAKFIEWYLDNDGYIRKDRDGVIRYFTIDKNNPVWGNTKEEVIEKCPHIFESLIESGEDVNLYIKSFTFIEGSLDENKELLEKDKTYKANLMAQDEVTKQALLHKCWKPVQDDLAIVDYGSLESITSNFLEPSTEKFYSLDVAGFGKDLAVGMTWLGWDITKINIKTKSGPDELYQMVENDREEAKIPKHKVIYDNDGIGWSLAGKDYISFNGNAPVIPVTIDGKKVKENYQNLKTQCYYGVIEKIINKDLMKITETEIYVDGVKTRFIKIKNEVVDVLDLLKADIKAIKRAGLDKEGKKQINTKAEQKNLLGGRSPDFGDTTMMRYYFELEQKKTLLII